jgi:enoyl-CoA hydratase/carnithine racemase
MTETTTAEAGIGRIVLDNPPLNILTGDMLRRLGAELGALADQPDLRVLLFTAAGKHFSAGADVGEHLPPHHLSLIPLFLETVAALDASPCRSWWPSGGSAWAAGSSWCSPRT